MAKQKSVFELPINVDPSLVNNLILSWLQSNEFMLKEKDNTRYYASGDGVITALRCFEYSIEPWRVVIYAYLNSPKKPVPLDNSFYMSAAKRPYLEQVQLLMQQITNLSAQSENVNYAIASGQITPDSYQYNMQMQTNLATASFEAQKSRNNDSAAVGALIMGLVDIVLNLFGITLGIYLTILAIFCGITGLKSNKKILAIIGLVFTGLSVILYAVALTTGNTLIRLH